MQHPPHPGHGPLGAATALTSLDELEALAPEWNALALAPGGSPFLTVEWLSCLWRAYATAPPDGILVRDERGRLVAGALYRRARRRLEAPTGPHSGHWDVVAADPGARAEVWRVLARVAPGRLRLSWLIDGTPELELARRELAAAGFRVFRRGGPHSPYLTLPATWDALRSTLSRNLRSQLSTRRNALERRGELRLRTIVDGPEVPEALERVFSLEGGGWKSRAGTSILSNPRTERMFRTFTDRAAAAGWLRLYLLEVDGRAVAGDLGCSFGSTGYLLKTGFDETLGKASPGLVLRAEVLRAAIEEGLTAYDFLGGPDAYKLRWGSTIRQRVVLDAFRGVSTVPDVLVAAVARPAARRVRAAWRARPRGRSYRVSP